MYVVSTLNNINVVIITRINITTKKLVEYSNENIILTHFLVTTIFINSFLIFIVTDTFDYIFRIYFHF